LSRCCIHLISLGINFNPTQFLKSNEFGVSSFLGFKPLEFLMQRPNTLPSSTGDPSLLPSKPSLPHDLIKSSLDYLPDGELLRARLVNTKWLQAVADCVECFLGEKEEDGRVVGRWRDTLEDGHLIPKSRRQLRMALCVITEMTLTFQQHGVQDIWLSPYCEQEGDKTVAIIARHCPWLTGACLAFSRVTDLSLPLLAAMPKLAELNLRQTMVTSVAPLSTCKNLKKLVLRTCNSLTDAGIAGLESLPALEELDLSGTEVASVAHLSASRSLRKLMIDLCVNLTDAGIRGLESIPTLEELDLSTTSVASVSQFSASRSLKKLIARACTNLTDSGIAGLEGIPTLEELDVNCTSVTSVANLSACPALRRLNLSRNDLTTVGILGLELIPTLEEIDLRDTNVTSVVHLSALKKLFLR
jgi:hypothetical protein